MLYKSFDGNYNRICDQSRKANFILLEDAFELERTESRATPMFWSLEGEQEAEARQFFEVGRRTGSRAMPSYKLEGEQEAEPC